MKTAIVVMLMLAAPVAHAFDHSENPDRYMSVGLDVSKGMLPGMEKTRPAGTPSTDGGFVKGALDVRVPVTNILTFKVFGNATGVNNNLAFTEGSEIGIGLRVYVK